MVHLSKEVVCQRDRCIVGTSGTGLSSPMEKLLVDQGQNRYWNVREVVFCEVQWLLSRHRVIAGEDGGNMAHDLIVEGVVCSFRKWEYAAVKPALQRFYEQEK